MTEHPVVASLAASATLFERQGDRFAAAFTRDMAEQARAMPALYRHWAAAQAERAMRRA